MDVGQGIGRLKLHTDSPALPKDDLDTGRISQSSSGPYFLPGRAGGVEGFTGRFDCMQPIRRVGLALDDFMPFTGPSMQTLSWHYKMNQLLQCSRD